MALKTTYVDDVLDSSMAGRRRFNMIENDDDTVSFEDVTTYSQEGDYLNADYLNEANGLINDAVDHMADELIHVPEISEDTVNMHLMNDGSMLTWIAATVEFYVGSYSEDFPETGVENTIYIDTSDSSKYYMYMWNGTSYILVSGASTSTSTDEDGNTITDVDTISTLNPAIVVSVVADDFEYDDTYERYTNTISATGISTNDFIVWRMVRSGDVLSLEESDIYAHITDVICSTDAVTIVSTEKPSQDFSLKIKIVL